MLARMRPVQEGFKPLPNRYLVTQTLDQSTWQRREQRRPQLRPQLQQRKRWRPHTSPPRVDSSNPEERFKICLTSRKIVTYSFTFGWEFLPTEQVPTFIFSRADVHSGEIFFFGPQVLWAWHYFFPEHRRQTKSQIPTWRLLQRTQGSNNTSQGALCCWWRPRRHKRSISTWELPCYLSWVTDEIFQSFVPLVLRRTFVFWGSLVHGYQVMWLARIETKSVIPCLLARG